MFIFPPKLVSFVLF